MARNIPSNEKQRPETKMTLPSKPLIESGRLNKEFLRQKKAERIHLHQTSSARDAKGTTLRKGRKRQKKSKRIYLHQTNSARDAKGTTLRTGKKRDRKRGTQV